MRDGLIADLRARAYDIETLSCGRYSTVMIEAAHALEAAAKPAQPIVDYSFVCYSCNHEWERQVAESDCQKCGATNTFCAENQRPAAAQPEPEAPAFGLKALLVAAMKWAIEECGDEGIMDEELDAKASEFAQALAAPPQAEAPALREAAQRVLDCIDGKFPLLSRAEIEKLRAALAAPRSASVAEKFDPNVTYVCCPERDIECGRNQARWCAACPLKAMLATSAPSPQAEQPAAGMSRERFPTIYELNEEQRGLAADTFRRATSGMLIDWGAASDRAWVEGFFASALNAGRAAT